MARNSVRKVYLQDEGDTIPKVLLRTAIAYGDNKVALRHKKFGVWQEYTWKDYYQKVKYSALGLMSLGVKPGDKVGIVGNAEPQAYWSLCGVLCAGASAVPLWPVMRRDELKYIIQHSDTTLIIAEDQEQVDKILEMRDEIPKVGQVVYWDQKGLWNYKEPLLMTFEQLIEAGQELEARQPMLFEQTLHNVQPDDIAIINYTSGTTGWPKGATWTHAGLLQSVEMQLKLVPFHEDEEIFSMLLADFFMSSLPSIATGAAINLAEGADTVARDLREVGWTTGFVMGLEQQASEMQVKISYAAAFKRLMYNLFVPVGYKKIDTMTKEEKLSRFWQVLHGLGHIAFYRALRDKHGLLKVRNAYVTAAATNPGALRLFHAIGVPVRNMYIMQECHPIASTSPGEFDSESVGKPYPGREVRIADGGEILPRGTCTSGYYKNPEATAELIDQKRWVHTGDAGFLTEDGRLVILDRMSDLMTMKDGSVFSPLWIENKLKFSPYIRQAIITGQERNFIGAIISINVNFVKNWADKCQLPYTTMADLSQKTEVYNLIQADIEKRVNRTLPEKTRVKKFALLPKEMDIDDAEVTRTWKLRRNYVAQRYSDLIQALYTDKTDYTLDVESSYEDGRKAHVRIPVKILSIGKEQL